MTTRWGTWSSVSEGRSTPGAPVTAIPYGAGFAVFLADPGGGIYFTAGHPDTGWDGWAPISGRVTTPGARIAAVPSGNRIALFVTDVNGEVFSVTGSPDSGWDDWHTAAQGSSTPGAPVCAVRDGNRIALFIVDPNGGAYTTAGYPEQSSWGGSWTTVSEGRSTPGAPITAVPYGDGFSVFVADPNGGVYFTTGNPETGWDGWAPVQGLLATPGAQITAAPMGTRLALFMTDHLGEVYTTSTASILRKVEIKFDTHNDNKDYHTLVNVFLKNHRNNSLTPEPSTDHLTNYLALQRYLANGDLTHGEHNPYLAYGFALGYGEKFDDPSSRTFTLTLVSDHISVDDVVLPQIDIHTLADGYDQWIFDYTVRLTFDNGTLTFTSAVDGVRGIILDQDNRNHSGIGSENWLRTLPIPVPPKAITDSVLKKVTLQLSTHNDNKNSDTRLNVHIVNRLNASTAQDLAIGLDLFHDQEFPDSGPRDDLYREFSWSAEQNTLASRSIRLSDIVLPMVYIVIEQADEDRWIFDYQVTFEFVDPQDFNQKPQVFSSETRGNVLDQDNNKHASAYQGRPFPTVAPPTAPRLTYQPVERTGENRKTISLPFLRRKFDEFINSRNDVDTGDKPPLQKLRLGSTLGYPGIVSMDVNNPIPLPESYSDMQSLVNGDDGQVHRVRNPQSLGQLKALLGIGDSYLGEINSASFRISIDALQTTPIALTIEFESGGYLWNNAEGLINLVTFVITLKLTLKLATIVNQFQRSHTVVDVLAWVDNLEGLSRDQVIDVKLVTGSSWDTGEIIRTHIRDTIFDSLSKPGVITNRSPRDSINGMVTSLLLGGIADDERNTDDNNAVINDIRIAPAGPEFSEDTIVINYSGPKNVFVPEIPADWPTRGNPSTTYDFSPSTLANIDHIVVLTMENRSFDHMLGYLSLPVEQGGRGRQDVDGLKGGEVNPYQGIDYPSFALDQTRFAPGPPNGYESVHHAINGGKMDGFVRSHAELNSDAVAGQVMGYHTRATVPVYDALARDFAIGHRWFASHPGPTYPNRFYELTGRPNLDAHGFWEFHNSSPLLPVFTPTIFDYLKDAIDPISGAPVTWRFFEDGVCSLRRFERYTFDHTNIVNFSDPVDGFLARANTGQLPGVSFIDPHFVDLPPGSNCDEPPGDIADGQKLVQRIVNAVVASPAWNKTLLLIVYDEHGGFYDHVPPPQAARVSEDMPISTSGVRVPAIVVTPWVPAGGVFGYDSGLTNPGPPSSAGGGVSTARRAAGDARDLHFDHTSILKTIARRFLSPNPPYMGARYAAANDLSAVIGTEMRHPQFLPFIPYHLQFAKSGMMLDVKFADKAPGTLLWQYTTNGGIAQDFSFEDAGNGFVYIRSHVSNLYVTAQAADSVLTGGATPSAGAKWMLSPISSSVLDRNLFLITNQDYPNVVLQPADPSQSESPVVLTNGGADVGIPGGNPNAWKISSRSLSDEQVTTQ